MPKRNRNQCKWSIVVRAGILVLLAALPTAWHTSKGQVSPAASKENTWHCVKRPDILRDSSGKLRWFSSRELIERVIDKQLVERPGVLGKNNLKGVATVQVVIDKNGRVACTRGVNGQPLGIASATRTLRKWTFKPYRSNGKRKSIVGTLSIPYDFGE